MTTDVGIANLALSHLGDSANIQDLTEPSAQAGYCNQFYPIALATLLEMFPWKFATRRIQPAQRSDLSYGSWQYIYNEPDQCIRIWGVLPANYVRDIEQAEDFDTETDSTGQAIILTNTPLATVRYTVLVDDPAKFTPLFVEAFGWLLASYVAGPLVKGDTGAQEGLRCYQSFLAMYGRAANSSAGQSKKFIEHIPDHIRARHARLFELPTR